jgi:hypothetical protein
MIFVSVLLEIKHSWNKNAIWDVNNKKWRKWCKFDWHFLFSNAYCLPVLINNTNAQFRFFVFDSTIYRPFVPNTAWKRDSLQIMIFVNVCSTWRMVELKNLFETWITINDVNVVFVHSFKFNKHMAYLCSQRTPNIQIKYFMFHWSIYSNLC